MMATSDPTAQATSGVPDPFGPNAASILATGHHDDERGLVTTYMLHRPSALRLWIHFLVNTPTIVATVDAALATVIVVLVLQVVEAPRAAVVVAGAVAFVAVWGTLFPLQRHILRPLRDEPPRFPTPPEAP